MKAPLIFSAIVAGSLLFSLPAFPATVGMVDTFEDGTTQGWESGFPNPTPPVNVPTGGPLGINDNYLRITSKGGFGAGSRLVAFNTTQWSDDYLAEGITSISADLNNQGSTDLQLRLAMAGPGGDSSISAVSLPAGSGWLTVHFPVTAADLTAVDLTGADINATLAGVTTLRLLHTTTPDFEGVAIAAVLGVDNIRAVPLPATVWMLGSGLIGLVLQRRRKNTQ